MLFTLLEGLLTWLLLAFAGGCTLGRFLRTCSNVQLHHSEPPRATAAHPAQVGDRA